MHTSFCDLRGKAGIVLGLANDQSIAAAIVRRLHNLGAELLVSCLNDKAAPHARVVTDPLGVELKNCDLRNRQELETFIDRAIVRFSKLDFVIHSIAWAPIDDLHGRVIDSSREGFSEAIALSCHSFAELAKLTAPHMTGGGSMLTMTYHGSAEVVPSYGIMGPVKSALESTVRYIAAELGPQNIRVHAVSPGPILTRAASGIAHFDELMKMARDRSPLGRLVNIDEVANLTAFLCASESSGMTGQTIYVDAGFNVMA
ncbi:SDR family oxidoreductase [Orrella daihaiensis]|uniref:Enoyl-[acyl-carrier-protein] reductase [NADH] n=1 Tax=Orrella daihaiensis TaxID=2782176 RepID=A0ABY4AN88_9BURK|nr:SDR family oxidoreductase [Orrella daihaiensis]UOD50855.1 SDR family oxidoreductase [Orrella daihaiensis]